MRANAPGREFANVNTRMLLELVERRAGTQAIELLLASAGEQRPESVLRDDASWSSQEEFLSLTRAAADLLGGIDALTTLYADVPLVAVGGSSAELIALVHALGSPTELVKHMNGSNHFGSLVLDNHELAPDAYRVKFRTVGRFEPELEICAFMRGVIPLGVRVFGFNQIDVRETACQCRGDDWCTVEVSWDDTRDAEFLLEEATVLRRVAEKRLETFQETIADIVSAEDLDVVLDRIVNAASRATTSTAHVLEIDGIGDHTRYYRRGVDVETARTIAERSAAGEDGYVSVEVASATRRYGRLIVVDLAGGGAFERPALESYARLASTALDSAVALEEARREARTSFALLGLAASLAEIATRQEVAAKIVQAMPAVLDCDACAVMLREDGELRLGAQEGFETSGGTKLDVDALGELEPYLRGVHVQGYEDMTDASRVMLQRQGLLASATAPIVIDDVLIGLLVAAVRHTPERLTQDAHLVQRFVGLASQAAIALRNASLVDQIRHQSLHDHLTGLPNRVLILDRAEQLLARSARSGTPCAALYIDLDGFKDVNDTRGHAAGDRLLQAVAERLSAIVRDSDTVGRLGGDEFVVLADAASLDAGVEVLAERLLEVVQEPFHLSDGDVPASVQASIGIALAVGGTAEALLFNADTALYRAKRAGKSCFRVFDATMSQRRD